MDVIEMTVDEGNAVEYSGIDEEHSEYAELKEMLKVKESMLNELVLEELRMEREYDELIKEYEGILSRKESELTMVRRQELKGYESKLLYEKSGDRFGGKPAAVVVDRVLNWFGYAYDWIVCELKKLVKLIPDDFHEDMINWLAVKTLQFHEWVCLVIDEVNWF